MPVRNANGLFPLFNNIKQIDKEQDKFHKRQTHTNFLQAPHKMYHNGMYPSHLIVYNSSRVTKS